MTTIQNVKWANLEGIQLANELLSVVILPCLGGKVASLKHIQCDFEVAAQSKFDEYKIPKESENFHDFDASGFDDAFPNIDEARILIHDQEIHYPDHGEIWSQSFDYEIQGEILKLTYESTKFPYHYVKKISLEEDQLSIEYAIQNPSSEPFPCLWAFHGLVRYEEDMELIYPEGTNGFYHVLEALSMKKYYVDGKCNHGKCGYRYPKHGMICMLNYDVSKLPYLGIWITTGGFRGDYNCAFEPTTSFYDEVGRAIGNGTNYLLDLDHPLEFTITIRLSEEKNHV